MSYLGRELVPSVHSVNHCAQQPLQQSTITHSHSHSQHSFFFVLLTGIYLLSWSGPPPPTRQKQKTNIFPFLFRLSFYSSTSTFPRHFLPSLWLSHLSR